jgi:hypothetical protein
MEKKINGCLHDGTLAKWNVSRMYVVVQTCEYCTKLVLYHNFYIVSFSIDSLKR